MVGGAVKWQPATAVATLLFVGTCYGRDPRQVNVIIDSEDDLLAIESSNDLTFADSVGGPAVVAAPSQFRPPKPQPNHPSNKIPASSSKNHAYSFSFQNPDGSMSRFEEGRIREDGVLTKSGRWEWTDQVTGKTFVTEFIADELGFRPIGSHLLRSARNFPPAASPPITQSHLTRKVSLVNNKRKPKGIKLLKFRRPLKKTGGRISFKPLKNRIAK